MSRTFIKGRTKRSESPQHDRLSKEKIKNEPLKRWVALDHDIPIYKLILGVPEIIFIVDFSLFLFSFSLLSFFFCQFIRLFVDEEKNYFVITYFYYGSVLYLCDNLLS